MAEGISSLEQRIEQFESLLEEMRTETREAHSVLKAIKQERKEYVREKASLSTDIKKEINSRVDEIVKTELDRIGPKIRQQTNMIYDKVGKQIDKLIDIALGKEFANQHGREDIRPKLAEKLKEWIREIIESGEWA